MGKFGDTPTPYTAQLENPPLASLAGREKSREPCRQKVGTKLAKNIGVVLSRRERRASPQYSEASPAFPLAFASLRGNNELHPPNHVQITSTSPPHHFQSSSKSPGAFQIISNTTFTSPPNHFQITSKSHPNHFQITSTTLEEPPRDGARA